jgi:hypothetical protein
MLRVRIASFIKKGQNRKMKWIMIFLMLASPWVFADTTNKDTDEARVIQIPSFADGKFTGYTDSSLAPERFPASTPIPEEAQTPPPAPAPEGNSNETSGPSEDSSFEIE